MTRIVWVHTRLRRVSAHSHTSANSNVLTLFYSCTHCSTTTCHAQCTLSLYYFVIYTYTTGTIITSLWNSLLTHSTYSLNHLTHSLISHSLVYYSNFQSLITCHTHSAATHSHTQSIYYSLLTFTDGVLLAQAWNNCGHTSSPSLHSLPRDDVATATQ